MSEFSEKPNLNEMFGGVGRVRNASNKEKKKHRVGGGNPELAEAEAILQHQEQENKQVQKTEAEKQTEIQLKLLKSRFWRLGGSEADARKLDNIAEAQNKVLEQESIIRRDGKNYGLSGTEINQILNDEYPIEKVIEFRKNRNDLTPGFSKKEVKSAQPEIKQTFSKIELYELGLKNGLAFDEMDRYTSLPELAKEIGRRIEARNQPPTIQPKPQEPKPKIEEKPSTDFKIKRGFYANASQEDEAYGVSPTEAMREREKALKEKEDRSDVADNRRGANIMFGKEKKTGANAVGERAILGKSDEEKEMENAFGGKQMTEREARAGMLGKVDVEEGEQKGIDAMLGKEVEKNSEIKEVNHEKIIIADISDYVEAYARQEARRQWQQTFRESGFFRRVRLHMGENYYVDVKLYNEIKKKIEDNKHLMLLLETRVAGKKVKVEKGESQVSALLDAIAEAYLSEINLSEDEKAVSVQDKELKKEFSQDMGQFIYDAIKHKQGRAEFEQKIAPLLSKVYKSKKDKIGEGNVFASNIWSFVESYKENIEKLISEKGGENPEAVRQYINGLMNVDLMIARKEYDIKREPKKLNILDKGIASLSQNKIFGGTANPAIYGAFATAGAIGGRILTRRGVRSAAMTATGLFLAPSVSAILTPILIGAGLGAMYAGIRRNKEVKQDWTAERERQAMGQNAQAGTEQLRDEKYMLQMIDAASRAQELSDEKVSPELVADTIARLELESAENIQELFRASAENAGLDSRLADMNKLRLALRKIQTNPDYSDEKLNDLIVAKREAILSDIKKTDTALQKFKLEQNLKAGLMGAMAGVAGGIISQEALFWGKELTGQKAGDTVLHYLARMSPKQTHLGWYDAKSVNPIASLGHARAAVFVPEGMQLSDHGHGAADLLYGDEKIADIKYDDHGRILNKETLGKLGMQVQEDFKSIKILPEDAKGIATSEHLTLATLQEKFDDVKWGEHQRIDWHHDGAQLSTFYEKMVEHPGKEQMLYLEKVGDRVVMDGHKVLENIVENLKEARTQFVNPDGSVDNKMTPEFIQRLLAWEKSGELAKHLEAVVLPDKHSAVSAVFGADAQGRAALSEKLSELCTPENLKDGKLPFMVEFRIDGHVLATASEGGHGLYDQTIEKITSQLPETYEINNTFIVPTLTDEMEPGVATPAARRFKFEKYKVTEKIPEYVPNQYDPEKEKARKKKISDLYAEIPSIVRKDMAQDEPKANLENFEPEDETIKIETPRQEPDEETDSLAKFNPEEKVSENKEEDEFPDVFKSEEKIKPTPVSEGLDQAIQASRSRKSSKSHLEKIFTAQYRLLWNSDDLTAGATLEKIMEENGLSRNDWKITRNKDKLFIKLNPSQNVNKLVEAVTQQKAKESNYWKETKRKLAKAKKELQEGKVPHMRINLIGGPHKTKSNA